MLNGRSRDGSHGRLPWPTPEDLDPAQRAVYDHIVGGARADTDPAFRVTDAGGRLEGPFNAMLLNPAVGDAVQQLGVTIRYRTALPDRCREVAILTLAVERTSDFEWYAHERVGRRIGLTDAELSAVRAGTDADSFRRDERLIRRAVIALCRSRDLDEELYAELITTIGHKQLDEVVTLTSYYELLALSLRVWRTPLPEGEVAVMTDQRAKPGSVDGNT